MQGSVWVTVERGAEMEQAVLEAGRQAMRHALAQAGRAYEGTHPACPPCGSEPRHSQGTVRRHATC